MKNQGFSLILQDLTLFAFLAFPPLSGHDFHLKIPYNHNFYLQKANHGGQMRPEGMPLGILVSLLWLILAALGGALGPLGPLCVAMYNRWGLISMILKTQGMIVNDFNIPTTSIFTKFATNLHKKAMQKHTKQYTNIKESEPPSLKAS